MKTNRVIENNHGNTLVRTEGSSKDGFWFESRQHDVIIDNVLSDAEVLKIWSAATNNVIDDSGLALDHAKKWIAFQPGYAISTCVDSMKGITYDSVVKFTKYE